MTKLTFVGTVQEFNDELERIKTTTPGFLSAHIAKARVTAPDGRVITINDGKFMGSRHDDPPQREEESPPAQMQTFILHDLKDQAKTHPGMSQSA